MMKFVVRSQRRQGPHSNTVGKENLRSSINPSCSLQQLAPVWCDIVQEPISCPLQCQSSTQQYGHHKVGEQSCEPDDLTRAMQTLGNDAIDTQPGQCQTSSQLPLDIAQTFLKTLVDLQNTVSRNKKKNILKLTSLNF